jgi:hypothetical protein
VSCVVSATEPRGDAAAPGAAAGAAEIEWLSRQRRREVSLTTLADPKPLPGAAGGVRAPERPRHRQVNFRLTREGHAGLERAAALVHMRPTALARLLVVRGVDQILREADSRA